MTSLREKKAWNPWNSLYRKRAEKWLQPNNEWWDKWHKNEMVGEKITPFTIAH